MVVASSIKRAIEYYMAINKLLEERKSPYKAIVAFTGEIKYEGSHIMKQSWTAFQAHRLRKSLEKILTDCS